MKEQLMLAFIFLPSKIRKKFENDPKVFLDFVCNPENVDELRTMGLLPKQFPPVPVVTDPGQDS